MQKWAIPDTDPFETGE